MPNVASLQLKLMAVNEEDGKSPAVFPLWPGTAVSAGTSVCRGRSWLRPDCVICSNRSRALHQANQAGAGQRDLHCNEHLTFLAPTQELKECLYYIELTCCELYLQLSESQLYGCICIQRNLPIYTWGAFDLADAQLYTQRCISKLFGFNVLHKTIHTNFIIALDVWSLCILLYYLIIIIGNLFCNCTLVNVGKRMTYESIIGKYA